jgi:aryl-alcohol dehydrogenase-like predicted oxidoreductase
MAEGPGRDTAIVATKLTSAGRKLDWIRGGPESNGRETIRAAVEGSLRRLGTDYIDLYQIHWPDRNQPMFGGWRFDETNERAFTPIREQMAAMAELVTEGKIRYVGLSNENPGSG